MSWSLIIGLLVAGLGLFNLWMTFANPKFFDHLEEMKQTYGEVPGLIGHMVMYVCLPIFGGLIFLASEFLF